MNILTTEQKEDVSKIYKRKFLITLLTVLLLCGIIFLIAVAPVYLQLASHSKVLERKIKEIQSSELVAIQDERNAVVKETNILMELFESSTKSPRKYVEVITRDFEGVYIKTINVDYQKQEIAFSGTAETRNDLVSMTDFLNNGIDWADSVEVPTTLLTKSVDIPFNLKIKLNTKYVN